jgi:hypothetical protein
MGKRYVRGKSGDAGQKKRIMPERTEKHRAAMAKTAKKRWALMREARALGYQVGRSSSVEHLQRLVSASKERAKKEQPARRPMDRETSRLVDQIIYDAIAEAKRITVSQRGLSELEQKAGQREVSKEFITRLGESFGERLGQIFGKNISDSLLQAKEKRDKTLSRRS